MTRLNCRYLLTLTGALLFARLSPNAAAQQVSGRVLAPDGVTPAPGALVLLTHPTRSHSIVSRTVTDVRGFFSLHVPAHFSVVLRVLRIGFEPFSADTLALLEGETRTVRIVLADKRVTLAAVSVQAKNRCEVRPDGAQLVAQLFNQARTALIASTASMSGEAGVSEIVNYVRNENRQGRLVGNPERSRMYATSAKPYASVSAELLARDGYAVDQDDGTILYAPDAEVLVSDSFLAGHCLALAQGAGESAGLIGVAFRPVQQQVGRVDIQGTLWMTPVTAELRYLEFTYLPLAVEFQRMKVGGRVEYSRTSAGGSFVSKWAIRKPRLSDAQVAMVSGIRGAGTGAAQSVTGVQVTGGEVQSIRLNDRLMYSSSEAAHAGSLAADAVALRLTPEASVSTPLPPTPVVTDVNIATGSGINIGTPPNVAAVRLPAMSVDERKSVLEVRGLDEQPVAYATVVLNGGMTRVTDTTGRLVLNTSDDSISVLVRRLGFTSFEGKLARSSKAEPFHITLAPNSPLLSVVNVRGQREKSVLERTGFYGRMMDVQRGAVVGEFFTPEQLEARGSGKLSNMLHSSRYLTFGNRDGKTILLGRPVDGANCAMNIVLDGIHMGSNFDVDELVGGNEVAAIEIYLSSANAPMALRSPREDGRCGIVAIWTGARR